MGLPTPVPEPGSPSAPPGALTSQHDARAAMRDAVAAADARLRSLTSLMLTTRATAQQSLATAAWPLGAVDPFAGDSPPSPPPLATASSDGDSDSDFGGMLGLISSPPSAGGAAPSLLEDICPGLATWGFADGVGARLQEAALMRVRRDNQRPPSLRGRVLLGVGGRRASGSGGGLFAAHATRVPASGGSDGGGGAACQPCLEDELVQMAGRLAELAGRHRDGAAPDVLMGLRAAANQLHSLAGAVAARPTSPS